MGNLSVGHGQSPCQGAARYAVPLAGRSVRKGRGQGDDFRAASPESYSLGYGQIVVNLPFKYPYCTAPTR